MYFGRRSWIWPRNGRSALLQRDVKPPPLNPNPAAKEIGRIVERVRNRKGIGVGDKSGYAGTRAGVAIIGEVGNEPAAGKQIEAIAAEMAARVERLLVERDTRAPAAHGSA